MFTTDDDSGFRPRASSSDLLCIIGNTFLLMILPKRRRSEYERSSITFKLVCAMHQENIKRLFNFSTFCKRKSVFLYVSPPENE